MKTFELTIHRANEPTKEAGWHLVWMGTSAPLVLWANAGQTAWREGVMQRPVDYWAGPVPERKSSHIARDSIA